MEKELQFQHDMHNSLQRISERLYIFEQEVHKKKLPASCYIIIEYLKTHIQTSRRLLDERYTQIKNKT